MTTARDDLDFRAKRAVSVDEMMRHMNELQPTIIHFSGHGGGSDGGIVGLQDCSPQPPPAHRHVEAAADAGIYLQDEQRQLQHVTARALNQMISSAAPSARIVLLNACFSDAVADALRSVVDCVVGMRGATGDDAARSFAVGSTVPSVTIARSATPSRRQSRGSPPSGSRTSTSPSAGPATVSAPIRSSCRASTHGDHDALIGVLPSVRDHH